MYKKYQTYSNQSIQQPRYIKEKIDLIKKRLFASYKGSKIQWIAESSDFPKKVNYHGSEEKILKIVYTPMWNGETLENIMITFEDITEKERFAKTKKQYNLQQISQKTGLKIETLRSRTNIHNLNV